MTKPTFVDFRPPNPPWRTLLTVDPPTGRASVFYSDPLARCPVREVTRPRDNKSDPNLETMTYGLFSTCERAMRAGIVDHGVRYIFFITSRKGYGRVIVGYYDLGWYAPLTNDGLRDFALAAKSAKFIYPAIAIRDLPRPIRAVLGTNFRLVKELNPQDCASVLNVLDGREDATVAYLAEIDRLERFQQYRTGYRCWNRTSRFRWADARPHLVSGSKGASNKQQNRSPTDRWRCEYCQHEILNKSRLRICANCGGAETLIAIEE